MKIDRILITGAVLGCLLLGCRYPEGGASFTPIKNRIRGEWMLTKVLKNGVEDANVSPSEAESYQASFSFYKSQLLIVRYVDGKVSRSSSGRWSFGDKKKTIHAEFDSKYSKIIREYEIMKFANKELKVRFTDENTVWTLVFSQQISFIPFGY